MEVYLIRHTTPDISKEICYGQSDIALSQSFLEESKLILQELPTLVDKVYTSPLERCLQLAKLIPSQQFEEVAQLKEMNFGDWELKPWSDIPKSQITPWMEDFVNKQVPNGESMNMLAHRVKDWYKKLLATNYKKVALVTHAGPIRIILSEVNQTPLEEAFIRYSINYGEVILID